MLYSVVVTYANMRGVRAVDRIVDLRQRDAFYDFKGKKLTGEILDELN